MELPIHGSLDDFLAYLQSETYPYNVHAKVRLMDFYDFDDGNSKWKGSVNCNELTFELMYGGMLRRKRFASTLLKGEIYKSENNHIVKLKSEVAPKTYLEKIMVGVLTLVALIFTINIVSSDWSDPSIPNVLGLVFFLSGAIGLGFRSTSDSELKAHFRNWLEDYNRLSELRLKDEAYRQARWHIKK